MPKCNVVLNGEYYKGDIDSSLFTIAADGGYNMLMRNVDVFLGDGDSVKSNEILADKVIKLNPKKDMTDGEYAIDYAMDLGYDDIILYGADGGRLDHVMSNLNLLARASAKGVKIVAKCNRYDIYFSEANTTFTIKNVKDRTISIVPFDVVTHIIDMEGLYYKVSDFDIPRESSRGMSNVATSDLVQIKIGEGRCFIFVLSKEGE